MSTGYYLYTLATHQDFTSETLQRRQKKMNQGIHVGFLFDLNEAQTVLDTAVQFVICTATPADAIQMSLQSYDPNFDDLKFFINNFQGEVFFVVKDAEDLERGLVLINQDRKFLVVKCNDRKSLILVLRRMNEIEPSVRAKISLMPELYRPDQGKYVSAKDYLSQLNDKQIGRFVQRNHRLPFWNLNVQQNYELETLTGIFWETQFSSNRNSSPEVSVIIPTFNNSRFLINVITHLAVQNIGAQVFEVIVVDDGSDDGTSEILKRYVHSHDIKINLKYIYWSKQDLGRGRQNFFRPGQARNLAASMALGNYLVFLDSDMLVPESFVSTCLKELSQNDLIQFQRFHIGQSLSLTNPKYQTVQIKKDCYTEEKHYWNQLFDCADWNQLPNKWKYVCTYALGLKKSEFFEAGRIKRHFISYGFEDTDLGYRIHKKNKKFKLVQLPLLHLTNYSQMQYKNSFLKRRELLSVTAKLFFLDHLDLEIGTTLQTFLGGEKSILQEFKDHF